MDKKYIDDLVFVIKEKLKVGNLFSSSSLHKIVKNFLVSIQDHTKSINNWNAHKILTNILSNNYNDVLDENVKSTCLVNNATVLLLLAILKDSIEESDNTCVSCGS